VSHSIKTKFAIYVEVKKLSENNNEPEKKDNTIVVRHEIVKPKTDRQIDQIADDMEQQFTERANSEKTKEELESELSNTKAQLEEKEAIIDLVATKDFENEKQKLLAKIPDEQKRAYVDKYIGDDPERLENIALWTNILKEGIISGGGKISDEDEGIEKVPPASAVGPYRAETPQETKKEQLRQHIKSLFDILADPNASQKKKDSANREINLYYAEVRKGARASGITDRMALHVMECPKCHETMEGWRCQTCGHVIPEINRERPSR